MTTRSEPVHFEMMRPAAYTRLQRVADCFAAVQAMGYPPASSGESKRGKPESGAPRGNPNAQSVLHEMDLILAVCDKAIHNLATPLIRAETYLPREDARERAAAKAEKDAACAKAAEEHCATGVPDLPAVIPAEVKRSAGRFLAGPDNPNSGVKRVHLDKKMASVLTVMDLTTVATE